MRIRTVDVEEVLKVQKGNNNETVKRKISSTPNMLRKLESTQRRLISREKLELRGTKRVFKDGNNQSRLCVQV